MSAQGTVYDLGYHPHDGPRLGRPAAMRAIIVDGIRRALGLRRKPKAKVLPWGLIAAATIPAAFAVALTFLVEGFTLEGEGGFASHADYFDTIGTLSMLFIALVAPTLLIPDRQYGVISIYASRPVRNRDYLLARGASLAVMASAFILIPQATLYIGYSTLHVDGLMAGLVENASQIPPVLGTTLGFVLGYGAPAMLISLFVKRVAFATGGFVAAIVMTGALSDAIPRTSDLLIYKILAPLSLWWSPFSVRDWLFGEEEMTPLTQVGLPPWTAALVILALTLITALLAQQKYKKEL